MITDPPVYHPAADRVARALVDAHAVVVVAELAKRAAWSTWRGAPTPLVIETDRVCADPGASGTIGAALCSGILSAFPDAEAIIGIAETGLYWSALAARDLGLPHGFIRRSRSQSGRSHLVEARFMNGAKLVMVDDLVVTGATLESGIKALRAQFQATVLGAHVILSFGRRDAREREYRLGSPIHKLGNTGTVLREASRRGLISSRAASEIERFYADPDSHDWDLTELSPA